MLVMGYARWLVLHINAFYATFMPMHAVALVTTLTAIFAYLQPQEAKHSCNCYGVDEETKIIVVEEERRTGFLKP